MLLSGRHEPFRHRLTGAHELRQRVRPDGAAPFSAPESRGARTALAGSPFPGGKFFAEIQRGIALCGARESAAPAAGAKRKDNLRFSFLFELLPFPCFLIWRRLPTCDRFEKEYGRGFFLPCLSQPIRRVSYCTATQAFSSPQARHNSVAQLVSLEITDGTCGFRLSTGFTVGCADLGAPYLTKITL